MCAACQKGFYRILIVDDDIDLLMLLERKLEKEGFAIETAVSLPEAESILTSFHPHILLLDINVNGEDGRQLSFKLKRKSEHKETKVIILSGYDYSASRAALFGADELIAKPLHFDFLLHRIQDHLVKNATKRETSMAGDRGYSN